MLDTCCRSVDEQEQTLMVEVHDTAFLVQPQDNFD